MKTHMIRSLVGVAVCSSAWAQQQQISQDPVSTGRVLEVSAETGDLKLRAVQTGRPLLFRGLQSTPVYFATGRRGTFANIEAGQSATVYYAFARGRWGVSRIVIPEPEQIQRTAQAVVSIPPTVSRPRGTFHVPRVPNTFR